MTCNCGKVKQEFKNLVHAAQVPTPPPMTRTERIRLRGLRIEARDKRMAARNAAILATEQSKKNVGNQ